MKKQLLLTLCALLTLCLLCGCAQKAQTPKPGQAEREILTYEPVSPDKTIITLSRTGNTYIKELAAAFEEKNPDVQVVCLDVTGGNSLVQPVVDWVTNGVAPDVMIVTTNSFGNTELSKYFEDLSTSPVIANYQAEALNGVAVDSRIYRLPGPSQINAITYNKTLFEQYGWEVPKTFDEFVALCVQIREDTDGAVQPWNPNAKYYNEFLTVTEGFVYRELFGGLENRAWYDHFVKGEATYSEHMKPYYDMLQKLIDNDLLPEAYLSYSATTRGKEFRAGQIAMLNQFISPIVGEPYDFDFMPFPTTTGEEGYICNMTSYVLTVPIKEHTAKEKDAIDRFVAFFSSAEGQRVYIGKSLMVSSVKGTEDDFDQRLASLRETIEQGRMFTLLEFAGPLGARSFSLHGHAKEMTINGKTAEACMAETDAHPYQTPDSVQAEPPEVVGVAAEDFSILETSFCIADMYRELSGADIALINNNVAFRGNLMRIFKGDLTAAHVNTLLPRSLDNGSKLQKVTMTGRQLLEALNHPRGNDDDAIDSIYAYSGLKCKVAPWKPLGEKLLSVALADGGEIVPDSLYTVAFWEGTVYNQYIAEVVETYEGSFEELMTKWLRANATIAPAKDDRITLVWEE